jgi:hypothetical protein
MSEGGDHMQWQFSDLHRVYLTRVRLLYKSNFSKCTSPNNFHRPKVAQSQLCPAEPEE